MHIILAIYAGGSRMHTPLEGSTPNAATKRPAYCNHLSDVTPIRFINADPCIHVVLRLNLPFPGVTKSAHHLSIILLVDRKHLASIKRVRYFGPRNELHHTP